MWEPLLGLPTSHQAWLRRENTKGHRWLTSYEGSREMGQQWEADSLGLGENEGAYTESRRGPWLREDRFGGKVRAAVTCFVGLPWPRVTNKLLLS